jgi:photosystem II stability/assembly factor-like uncharacterized protein
MAMPFATISAAFGADGVSRLVEIGPLPKPTSDDPITEVQFVDETTAWAHSTLSLWRTRDGGRTWEIVHSAWPEHTLDNGRGRIDGPRLAMAHFETRDAGWVRVDRLTGEGAVSRTIYRTSDGGETWREQTKLPPIQGVLGEVQFLPQGMVGWAAGELRRDLSRRVPIIPGCLSAPDDAVLQPIIYQTNDGGLNWTQQTIPNTGCPVGTIFFRDAQNGVAVSGHHLYYTRNGGATWQASGFPDQCPSHKWRDGEWNEAVFPFFVDDSGWLGSAEGSLLRTVDGGKNWCEIQAPGEIGASGGGLGDFGRVYFDSPQHGWILQNDMKLYETRSGGSAWSQVEFKGPVNSFSCFAGHCWALADGKLYRVEQEPQG